MENKRNEDNKNYMGDDSDDELKFKNQEFLCQDDLQKSKMVLSEDNLKLKDLSLKAKLNSLVFRINLNVTKMQISINHQLFQTETALIASVNNFTKKNDTHDFGMSMVPNWILKYKVVYEDIFSLLHSHPWYIMDIIELYPFLKMEEDINKDESLHSVVDSLFNIKRTDMKQNVKSPQTQRLIIMLLNFARHIITSKQNNELHEIVSSKNMLHQLFQMIYNIQECNRKFTKETTEIITTYFLNFMDRLKALNILVHKHIADNLTIGKDIDNSAEEDKDDFEDANEIEESCFQVLKEISSKMLKTLSEKYNLSFGKG